MTAKIYFLYLLSLLCCIPLFITSAQQKKITIVAKVHSMPKGSEVHITGTGEDFGNWTEMLHMDKISDIEWRFEVTASPGDVLQFKFNRGNWNTEAVDINGIEFPNYNHIVKNDTILHCYIPNWRDLVQKNIVITYERLLNKGGYLELFEGWKYKIGDDTSWALNSFNDNDWKPVKNPSLNKADFESMNSKWTGNIWFRNYITVDSALWNKPFGLVFRNSGAAEVYLDGRLLYRFGKVGSLDSNEVEYYDLTPRHIMFDARKEHLLAVRLSNYSAEEQIKYNISVGFSAFLGDPDALVSNRITEVRDLTFQQMSFFSFLLAFAIMHLLLFIFYPKAKENLFYAVSMFSFAVVVFTGMQGNIVNSFSVLINISKISSAAVNASVLFGLLTVYASSFPVMPKQYKIFVLVSALFTLQIIFFPTIPYSGYVYYGFASIILLEIFRVVIRSAKRKEPWGWGWSIGIGFIVAMLFIAYQVLIILNVVRPLFGIYLVYVYGVIFLAITVSINLSKKISDTNKDLEKQLVQVKALSEITLQQERRAKDAEIKRKLLEADNERKTKELEEARKLQYSMLPKNIPPVTNLDIAVYMKTATEVGGDYYDFKYDNNGTLTIAVGDATGHGMRAGTLVAAIKGLFTAEPVQTDIIGFFNRCNAIIRSMQLGNLYMAMLIARISGDKIILSSAGMPPAFIYRKETKQVEELRVRGLPLGGAAHFNYITKEASLCTGDTVLFMSDGFPELFNKEMEMLDYEKACEIFRSAAELPPAKIIECLSAAAESWIKGTEQQDDITFVVVKRK